MSLGSWWTQTIALGPNESKEVVFSLGEIELRKYQFTVSASPQSPVVEKDYTDNSLVLKFGVGQVAAAEGEWMLY